MKNFTVYPALLLMCIALVAPNLFAQDPGKVVVKEVYGIGDGCKTDANGERINWDYKYLPSTGILKIDFEQFKLVQNDHSRCKLTIKVEYDEEDFSLYVYQAQITGEAYIAKGETVQIKTMLKSGRKKTKHTLTLDEKNSEEGDWETKVYEYPRPERPCGRTKEKFSYNISATRTGGDKSRVAIESKRSRFTKLQFGFDPCS